MNKTQKKYNQKCEFIVFRLRKEKDQKYIDFLQNQKNKTAFLRKAIEREIET